MKVREVLFPDGRSPGCHDNVSSWYRKARRRSTFPETSPPISDFGSCVWSLKGFVNCGYRQSRQRSRMGKSLSRSDSFAASASAGRSRYLLLGPVHFLNNISNQAKRGKTYRGSVGQVQENASMTCATGSGFYEAKSGTMVLFLVANRSISWVLQTSVIFFKHDVVQRPFTGIMCRAPLFIGINIVAARYMSCRHPITLWDTPVQHLSSYFITSVLLAIHVGNIAGSGGVIYLNIHLVLFKLFTKCLDSEKRGQ